MNNPTNVHHLQLVTLGDGAVIPADTILHNAKGKLLEIVLIGKDTDGELYFAGSHASQTTLWLIEKAKRILLDDVGRAP